jgi:hypothetical protein
MWTRSIEAYAQSERVVVTRGSGPDPLLAASTAATAAASRNAGDNHDGGDGDDGDDASQQKPRPRAFASAVVAALEDEDENGLPLRIDFQWAGVRGVALAHTELATALARLGHNEEEAENV